MKKLFPIIAVVLFIFTGCSKEKMTPDGKPQSDAKNNILRVDANAASSYWLSVAAFDPKNPDQSTSAATYYLLKNGLTASYECTFKATPGNVLFIEVYTGGQSVSCDIYYKGLKVTTNAQSDVFNSNSDIAPSHANLSYEIPQ